MTTRTWLMLALLLLSLLVGVFLLREPVFSPYFERKEELETLREEVNQLRERLAETKDAARSREVSWSGYGEPLDPAAQAARASDWTRRLEALTLGAGLEVVTVQPKREVIDEQGLIAFPITLTLAGDTGGLVRLLSQLQSLNGVVAVERLVVRRQSRGGQPLTIQATVTNYGVIDLERREQLAAERAKAAAERSS